MRTMLLGTMAVVLAGCGYTEGRFIDDFAELDCEYALECYDEAVLEYYDWTSVDDCLVRRGPEVAAWGLGCVYDPEIARECKKQMKDRECPAEGEDHEIPAICDKVYTDCQDDEPADTGDTGA